MTLTRETVQVAINTRTKGRGGRRKWPPLYRPTRAVCIGPVAIHRPYVSGRGFARYGWMLSAKASGVGIGSNGAFWQAVHNARQLAAIPEDQWPRYGEDGTPIRITRDNPVILLALTLINNGSMELPV